MDPFSLIIDSIWEENSMAQSMTGFGRAERADHPWTIKLEIKSVNHRYLDLAYRLPKGFHLLEEPMRQQLQQKIARGRVEIFLTLEELDEKDRMVKIDKGLLRGFFREWEELSQELPLPVATFEGIMQIPEIIEITEPEVNWKQVTAVVLKTLDVALEQLIQMRSAEGQRLSQDIIHKLTIVEHLMDEIVKLAPTVAVNYSNRLRERLNELLEGTSLTEERFTTEVAIFADRCSIDEEIVRLRSHTQQFRQSLSQNVPIGRKLDFLIQEMNREVNTIGSKSNDVAISTFVVELKSELERLREQIQNLE